MSVKNFSEWLDEHQGIGGTPADYAHEYAAYVAKEFAEWTIENSWIMFDGDYWGNDDTNERKTTSQLYDIFNPTFSKR